MKIISDYQPNVYRYDSRFTEGKYYYSIHVLVDGVTSSVIITNHGVSVDFIKAGTTTHTNIIPERLFPGKFKLSFYKINRIIKILEITGIEGKTYLIEDMKKMYKSSLKQVK